MDTTKKETPLDKIMGKVMNKKFMTILTIVCGIIAASVIIWRKVNESNFLDKFDEATAQS